MVGKDTVFKMSTHATYYDKVTQEKLNFLPEFLLFQLKLSFFVLFTPALGIT
jgi:hypothetical protein